MPRTAFLAFFASATLTAQSFTVLVLRFHNNSTFANLNWVGESIAETLRGEFGEANHIVIDRQSTAQAMTKLDLWQDATFTKASIIQLGRSVDADFVVYGEYNAKLSPDGTQIKDGAIEINGHFIDLRKFVSGPDVSEAAKLADLSRAKEHLAWQALNYFNAQGLAPFEQFLARRKLTRLDAEESYIHGVLSSDKEHQQKWFLQAANLDPNFVSPAYELGKMYLERKDPKAALKWFQRVPSFDPRYLEARFRMGLSAYQTGDYPASAGYFREVAGPMPLNEVYNNLAAAEDQLNLPPAIDDFRRALEGDPADVTYLFNLGAALLRRNLFDEAQKKLQMVLDHSPGDTEADDLLARAQEGKVNPPNAKPLVPARLKTGMDSTAFRQLKAMLQPKTK